MLESPGEVVDFFITFRAGFKLGFGERLFPFKLTKQFGEDERDTDRADSDDESIEAVETLFVDDFRFSHGRLKPPMIFEVFSIF